LGRQVGVPQRTARARGQCEVAGETPDNELGEAYQRGSVEDRGTYDTYLESFKSLAISPGLLERAAVLLMK
jgi:hypothetical protein